MSISPDIGKQGRGGFLPRAAAFNLVGTRSPRLYGAANQAELPPAPMTALINGGFEMPAEVKTHCKRGHELTSDNIYFRKGESWTECRKCRRQKKLECRATRRITAAELRVLIRRLKDGGRLNQILKRYRAGKYDRKLGVPGVTTDSWSLLRNERPALYAMVKRLADENIARPAIRTECRNGHPLIDNLVIRPNGNRRCRACDRDASRTRAHTPNLPESVIRQVLFRLHEGANYENLAGRQQGKYSGGRVVRSTTKLRAFRLKHPKIGKVMDDLAEKSRVAARNERASQRLAKTVDADVRRDNAAYPIIIEATEKLSREVREEVRTLMIIAVRERRLKAKDIRSRVKEFEKLYWKENKHSNQSKWGNASLDEEIFDDGPTTRGDTVTQSLGLTTEVRSDKIKRSGMHLNKLKVYP